MRIRDSVPSAGPMMLLLATVTAVAIFNRPADAQSVQTRDVAGKAAVGTALLGGIVSSQNESSRPIRRVLVTLSGVGVPGDVQAVTDDAGRFVFSQLPAGRYTLTAEKPGHVKTYHGSKRFGRGPATPIALADGQRLADVAVKILRGAAIEGTVLDENGVPLSSAQVTVLQPVIVNGERRLVRPPGTTPWATTDDRGRYRLYGLPPGDYTVRAGGGGAVAGGTRLTTASEITAALRDLQGTGRSGSVATGSAPSETPPQISRSGAYFPGVADAALAEFFTLAPAEERTGVDIHNGLVRASRLEGTVVGPGGQPLHNVLVGIANLSTGSLWGSPGLIRPRTDGRFSMASITPGRYAFFGRGTDADINPTPNEPLPLWTWTEVTINEQDVVDVVMQFLPGVSVSGRLIFQGSRPVPDLSRLRLSLVPLPSIAGAAVSFPPLSPRPDGSFEFDGVPPGKYRLAAVGTGAWSLRAAIANGVDVLDIPLDVPPGQPVSNIAVTLTDRPAEISGTLFDQLGRPAPEYAVVVFSTDRTHWTTAPRRMSGVVKLGSDGKFSVTGLPPGEYHLTALTDLDPLQLAETSFLEQLASASIKIVLGEGEKKVQDLTIQ